MKERLLSFMQDNDLTSSKLAEMLDVQPSGISHLLAGRNKPGFEFLSKMISVFPRLSPDWMLLGKGGMYRETINNNDVLKDTHRDRESLITDVIPKPVVIIDSNDKNDKETTLTTSIDPPAQNQDPYTDRVIILLSDGTFKDYQKADQ